MKTQTTTQNLNIRGMHCASCSAIITKKISKLSGVEDCKVNFATEKASITYNPNEISIENMNNEISKLGYTLVKQE